MMCIEIITRLVSLYGFLNVLWNSSGTQVNRLLLMMFIILHSLYMCIYTSFIYFYRYIFKIYTFAYIFLDASHRMHSLLAITHRKPHKTKINTLSLLSRLIGIFSIIFSVVQILGIWNGTEKYFLVQFYVLLTFISNTTIFLLSG